MSEDSEKIKEEMRKKIDNQTNSGVEVKVEVSGEQRITELENENENLKAKLNLVAEKAFENAKTEIAHKLNLNEDEKAEIKTIEDLERLKVRAEEKERIFRAEHHGASGKAPLSREPCSYGNDVKQYETYEDMIKDLNEREKSENPEIAQEAKAIKEQLFEKLKKRSFEVEIDLLKEQNELWKKLAKQEKEKGEK